MAAIGKLETSASVQAAYDAQYRAGDEFTQWRLLGAKYKARHVTELCAGKAFRTILDVGAGDGSLLWHLDQARFGDHYCAVEISVTAAGLLRNRGIGRLADVRAYDGYHIPYDDRAFDLAILSHVLEHVEHPRALLRELRRVARHSVIEVPVNYHPGENEDERLKRELDIGHINLFDPPLLRFLLRSEGFDVVADRVDIGPPEVSEYSCFVNANTPRTLTNQARFYYRTAREQARFRLARPARRERLAHSYTVLAAATDRQLKIF